jgi:hypothetical protein
VRLETPATAVIFVGLALGDESASVTGLLLGLRLAEEDLDAPAAPAMIGND